MTATSRPSEADKDRRLPPRILLLIPDAQLRDASTADLRGVGFSVMTPSEMDQGLILAEAFAPDIVVTAHPLRTSSGDVPFTAVPNTGMRSTIVLIDSTEGDARISALNAGADDVMSMPLSIEELTARCEALVRPTRRPAQQSISRTSVVRFGPLRLDLGRREAFVGGHEISITKTELALLERLCRNGAAVCTRSGLIDAVWGPNWIGARHLVDVHISNLHLKLRRHAPNVCFIQGVRGVGYRLGNDLLARTAA